MRVNLFYFVREWVQANPELAIQLAVPAAGGLIYAGKSLWDYLRERFRRRAGFKH